MGVLTSGFVGVGVGNPEKTGITLKHQPLEEPGVPGGNLRGWEKGQGRLRRLVFWGAHEPLMIERVVSMAPHWCPLLGGGAARELVTQTRVCGFEVLDSFKHCSQEAGGEPPSRAMTRARVAGAGGHEEGHRQPRVSRRAAGRRPMSTEGGRAGAAGGACRSRRVPPAWCSRCGCGQRADAARAEAAEAPRPGRGAPQMHGSRQEEAVQASALGPLTSRFPRFPVRAWRPPAPLRDTRRLQCPRAHLDCLGPDGQVCAKVSASLGHCVGVTVQHVQSK